MTNSKYADREFGPPNAYEEIKEGGLSEDKTFFIFPTLDEIYDWVDPIINYLEKKYHLTIDNENSSEQKKSKLQERKQTAFESSKTYKALLQHVDINLYRLDDFLANSVNQYCTIASPETLILTLEFLNKYLVETKTTLTMGNIHKLLLTSFYWALKIQEDSIFYGHTPTHALDDQKSFLLQTATEISLELHAKLGCLDVEEFTSLEKMFIEGTKYELPFMENSQHSTLTHEETLKPIFLRISANLSETTSNKLNELFIKKLGEPNYANDIHYQVLREIIFGTSKNLQEVMQKVAGTLNAVKSDNALETAESVAAKVRHQPASPTFIKSSSNELSHLLDSIEMDLKKSPFLSPGNSNKTTPK